MSRQLERYHELKKKGLCVACGKEPAQTARCVACTEKRRVVSQRQKSRRPRGNCRQCLTRKATAGLSSCQRCRERGLTKAKQQHKQTRIAVLLRYGGKCACCGLAVIKYLELDHKNNDGNIERKSLPSGVRGGRFFKYVLSQPLRTDLQVLCANCHSAKRYGGCSPIDHYWMHGPLTFNGVAQ